MGIFGEVASTRKGLGAFLGVFTPSILTILGVILFLRTGWVVGNAGLMPSLAIVILANCITLATAFSISAIATNMRVGSGGAYYMLSRSLGLEIGGAIGIPQKKNRRCPVLAPKTPMQNAAGCSLIPRVFLSASANPHNSPGFVTRATRRCAQSKAGELCRLVYYFR